MFKGKKLAVVVPAYNEEKLISSTIKSIPDYIDDIIVINDSSTDSTGEIVERLKKNLDSITFLSNKRNRGVGYTLKKGYREALNLESDIVIVMAGDGQMDSKYIPALINPILEENIDYTKGNRLTSPDRNKMPIFRRFGNSLLTFLTKISTGYWHIIDPQNGYTAISSKALKYILKEKITNGYGNPNDFLIALNINKFKVKDVEIPPIYGEEKSGIKIFNFIFKTSWILLSGFSRRIHSKYGGLNLHPILLFFYIGFLFTIICSILTYRMVSIWYADSDIPDLNALTVGISFLGACQFILFALWMDNEDSK